MGVCIVQLCSSNMIKFLLLTVFLFSAVKCQIGMDDDMPKVETTEQEIPKCPVVRPSPPKCFQIEPTQEIWRAFQDCYHHATDFDFTDHCITLNQIRAEMKQKKPRPVANHDAILMQPFFDAFKVMIFFSRKVAPSFTPYINKEGMDKIYMRYKECLVKKLDLKFDQRLEIEGIKKTIQKYSGPAENTTTVMGMFETCKTNQGQIKWSECGMNQFIRKCSYFLRRQRTKRVKCEQCYTFKLTSTLLEAMSSCHNEDTHKGYITKIRDCLGMKSRPIKYTHHHRPIMFFQRPEFHNSDYKRNERLMSCIYNKMELGTIQDIKGKNMVNLILDHFQGKEAQKQAMKNAAQICTSGAGPITMYDFMKCMPEKMQEECDSM